jgi:hypothetical protein
VAGPANGRTIFVADAHRDDGKRFVVRADEKLTAFVELESVIQNSTTFNIFDRCSKTKVSRFDGMSAPQRPKASV